MSTLDSRLPAAALEEGVMEAPPMTESFKDLNKTYTNLTQPSFRGFRRQFRGDSNRLQITTKCGMLILDIMAYSFSKIFIVIK